MGRGCWWIFQGQAEFASQDFVRMEPYIGSVREASSHRYRDSEHRLGLLQTYTHPPSTLINTHLSLVLTTHPGVLWKA